MADRCRYCDVTCSTSADLEELSVVDLPESGAWVHFGCLRHWLIDESLDQNFPGLTAVEKQVLKLRMDIDWPRRPHLAPLDTGTHKSESQRLAQIQQDAMKRLAERVNQEEQSRPPDAGDALAEAAKLLLGRGKPLAL